MPEMDSSREGWSFEVHCFVGYLALCGWACGKAEERGKEEHVGSGAVGLMETMKTMKKTTK